MNGRPAPRVLLGCDHLLKYTVGLGRGLADAGCGVALLSRDHDEEFGDEAGAMRRYVEVELGGRGEHLVLPGRVRQAGHWRAALGLRRRVGRFRPEVVHLQETVVNDPALVLAALRSSRRLAVTVHDPVEREEQTQPAWQRLGRELLLRHARLVFVHAEVLREQLLEKTGVRAPVVVVPHGIDPPRVLPFPGAPRLLMFGRIQPYKGVDVLLDAMAELWKLRPEVELTIAGQGPLPDHALLADPRVDVRNGHVREDDVEALFAAATCVVLPYREASQSGVGSLAKAYGRPIVATRVGGLPDLVGEAGRIVAPGRPDELAAALLEVAGERETAERLGRLGADSVDGEAGWDDVGRLTVDAYRSHLL